MKAERIGTTPREQLKWAIAETYRTTPRTEGDLWNLIREAELFAGGNPSSAAYIESDRYIETMLDAFRSLIESAVHGRELVGRQPRAPRYIRDAATGLYKVDDQKHLDVFETRVINRLTELLFRYGHLIKICQAPEKIKPGRKAKNAEEKPRGICENRFLAIKKTQLYCSPACLDRALKNKPEKKQPKVKKKKKR